MLEHDYENVMRIALKFEVDHACFSGWDASASFGHSNNILSASSTQTQF